MGLHIYLFFRRGQRSLNKYTGLGTFQSNFKVSQSIFLSGVEFLAKPWSGTSKRLGHADMHNAGLAVSESLAFTIRHLVRVLLFLLT